MLPPHAGHVELQLCAVQIEMAETWLLQMDRMDLVAKCDAHDLEAFKAEFDFA